MANPTIRIFDCETQETIDREMTDEEFAAHQENVAASLERIAARENA
jgi:hypothetical protein